jgi:hypothetical protein
MCLVVLKGEDMLYIVYKSGEEQSWHMPFDLTLKMSARAVEEVQADGDELEYIRNNFTNLPTATGRVARWFGETARFIIANLKVG